MRAAYGNGPLDYDLIIGALMERFRKLPEEIEGADVVRLLRITEKVDLFAAFKKLQAGQTLTPEESKMVGELLQADLERSK